MEPFTTAPGASSDLPDLLRLSPKTRQDIYLLAGLGPSSPWLRGPRTEYTCPNLYNLGGRDHRPRPFGRPLGRRRHVEGKLSRQKLGMILLFNETRGTAESIDFTPDTRLLLRCHVLWLSAQFPAWHANKQSRKSGRSGRVWREYHTHSYAHDSASPANPGEVARAHPASPSSRVGLSSMAWWPKIGWSSFAGPCCATAAKMSTALWSVRAAF